MRVETAPHTRRENAVALTRDGAALVRRGDRLAHDSRSAMLGSVSPRDLATAVRVLAAIGQSLEA